MMPFERIAYHCHLLLLTLLVSSQSYGATPTASVSLRQKTNIRLMI